MTQTASKPLLSQPDYLDLLNERLRSHPMYLEGMAFPIAATTEPDDDDDAARWPLSALPRLVLDTRWDEFGVFASVIDEMRQDFDVAPAPSPVAALPLCRQKAMAGTPSWSARHRQAVR